MRDIRKDLHERLAEIQAERAQLQRRFDSLAEREATVKTLIEVEETRWGAQIALPIGQPTPANGHGGSTPYSRFIMEALTGGKARNIQDLKRLAREMGIDFGKKNPGRVLHFALVGMKQGGKVERTASGEWREVSHSSSV